MRMAAVILRSTVVGFTLIDGLKIAPCNSQPFKASKLLLSEIYGHNFERFPFLSTLEARAAGCVLTTTTEFVMITVEVLTTTVVITDNRVQVAEYKDPLVVEKPGTVATIILQTDICPSPKVGLKYFLLQGQTQTYALRATAGDLICLRIAV